MKSYYHEPLTPQEQKLFAEHYGHACRLATTNNSLNKDHAIDVALDGLIYAIRHFKGDRNMQMHNFVAMVVKCRLRNAVRNSKVRTEKLKIDYNSDFTHKAKCVELPPDEMLTELHICIDNLPPDLQEFARKYLELGNKLAETGMALDLTHNQTAYRIRKIRKIIRECLAKTV